MKLFLLSTLCLVAYCAVGPDQHKRKVPLNLLDGFKHLNAYEIVTKLTFTFQFDTGLSPLEYICRVTYCHNEDTQDCYKTCALINPKNDLGVIGNRLKNFNSTEPDADIGVCKEKCQIDCGANKCESECGKLCGIHYSYKNRKEIEREFYDLIIKMNSLQNSKVTSASASL